MRAISLITTTVLATVLVAACGGKPKAKTATPSPVAGPKAFKAEPATGEIREALVQLRRVHFGFDTANLRPEARTALEEAAGRLRAYPNVHVYIDGHCDERGTTEYNLALGERRARAVSDYLMRLGIPHERLHIMTFGEEQPWVHGQDQVSYAKNRRVEFRLMRGDVRLVLQEGVLYDDNGQTLALSSL